MSKTIRRQLAAAAFPAVDEVCATVNAAADEEAPETTPPKRSNSRMTVILHHLKSARRRAVALAVGVVVTLGASGGVLAANALAEPPTGPGSGSDPAELCADYWVWYHVWSDALWENIANGSFSNAASDWGYMQYYFNKAQILGCDWVGDTTMVAPPPTGSVGTSPPNAP
jgi:hypothetical protein